MSSLPRPAAFVVLELDPVASVHHFNNPELSAVCENLAKKKYVGYLGKSIHMFWADNPYHDWKFYLVHQGLRPESFEKCISPEACIPVLPNTSHPQSRKPLDPSRPLPWPDCYVSEHLVKTARCPTKFSEEYPRWKVGTLDAVKADQCFDADELERYARLEERGLLPAGTPSDCMSIASSHAFESEDEELDSETSSQVESDGCQTPNSRTSGDDLRDLPALIAERLETIRISHDLFVVNVTDDLTTTDTVNDPDDYFEEARVLKQLIEEHETKRKTREVEEVKRIDEEHFANLATRQDGRKDTMVSTETSLDSGENSSASDSEDSSQGTEVASTASPKDEGGRGIGGLRSLFKRCFKAFARFAGRRGIKQ